jgi:hypothetical protein
MQDLESQVKYNGYPPKARAIVEANDRRDAEQARARDAAYLLRAETQEKREQLIWDTAKDMFESGHLKVLVDGKQVTALHNNRTIKCPECGIPLAEMEIMVYAIVKRFMSAGGDINALVIRDARGPLSAHVGMPCVFSGAKCRACGSGFQIFIQGSLI